METCLQCNTKNQIGARFCENCGNVLTKPAKRENQIKDLNFCHDCGKPTEPDADFCAYCGTAISGQCHQCGAVNTTDSKFCEKCAQPLNWICPICNNKNQAGAMYCESCGSDSIKKRKLYLNPTFLGAAASILILLSVFGTKYYQFNSDIDKAIAYKWSSDFDLAMNYAQEAKDNWLPFTNDKAQREINSIREMQEKHLENIANSSTGGSSQQSSNNSRSSQTSSSNESSIRYKSQASLQFEVYDNIACLTKSNLSVRALDNTYVFDVESYYHYAIVIEGSSGNGIRGNYQFTWSLVNDCGLSEPTKYDYKNYSGRFFIDGKYSEYRIKVYSDYLEVVGY